MGKSGVPVMCPGSQRLAMTSHLALGLIKTECIVTRNRQGQGKSEIGGLAWDKLRRSGWFWGDVRI